MPPPQVLLVSPPALGAEFRKKHHFKDFEVVPVESSKAMDAWVAAENYTIPDAHGKVPLNSSKVPLRSEKEVDGGMFLGNLTLCYNLV